MKLPRSWTTVTWWSKLLAILLFVLLPFGGFELGRRYQKNIMIPQTCQSSSVGAREADSCIFQDKTSKIVGTYVDKERGIRLELPEEWRGSVNNDGDLIIQSPDLLVVNEGYGLPIVGAEIRISEKKGGVRELNEYKISELDQGIKGGWIKNFRYTKVDGVKAIQYEWMWEGYGTATLFIKNDRLYSIDMYYNYDQKAIKNILEVMRKCFLA